MILFLIHLRWPFRLYMNKGFMRLYFNFAAYNEQIKSDLVNKKLYPWHLKN